VTADNARNNGTMIQYLNDAIQVIRTELSLSHLTQIPCLAHVIQLSLKCLLDTVKITAQNNRIITEWDDKKPNPAAHTKASPSNGPPRTLRLVNI
jgi:hypothetical protein